MKTTLALLSASLLLCGCASVGNNYDSRKVADIQPGKTSEADLVKMFGAPEQQGINSSGQTTMQWIYTEATAKGASFIPVVGLFAGGANTKSKSLAVNLTNGVVCSYNYSGGAFDLTDNTKADPEAGSPDKQPVNRK